MRWRVAAAGLLGVVATFALVGGAASARPSGRHGPKTLVPATTTTVAVNHWTDTVQVDAIDGSSLSVHSVRHPELAPYTVEADQDTIFQRVPGSMFAPQPGIEVGSKFSFTGVSPSGGTPPTFVRALRIFP